MINLCILGDRDRLQLVNYVLRYKLNCKSVILPPSKYILAAFRDLFSHIRNLRDHPYEFYPKMGFAIVGVMPDANGIGKPDIFMAKRL